MKSSITWMPVFIVIEAQRTVHASISCEEVDEHTKITVEGHDFWQRIGTAVARSDGGFTINLNALPINGKLVVRPPQPGEYPDPTASRE